MPKFAIKKLEVIDGKQDFYQLVIDNVPVFDALRLMWEINMRLRLAQCFIKCKGSLIWKS